MNSIENIKELVRAFRHHAFKPRSFPLVWMFVLLVTPSLLFAGSFLWDFITQAILGSPPGPIAPAPPATLYEMVPVAVSVVFTSRFVFLTTTMATRFSAWLESNSHLVQPGSHLRADWLLAEVDLQRKEMGIAAMPKVILFDPRDVLIGSAFAHVGLAGRGIVAFPFDWLDRSDDDEATRGVIAHELTHILNRDILIRQIAATTLDVFVHIPFQAALAFFLLLAGLSALVIPIVLLIAIYKVFDSGSFQILIEFGKSILRLLTAPGFAYCIEIMAMFTGIGGVIQTYASWVARAQESEADRNAAIVAGTLAMEKTILMLVEIEQAEIPETLTKEDRRQFAENLVRQSLWFLDFKHGFVRGYAFLVATLLYLLMQVLALIPGVPSLARGIILLWRQHPPTQARLEAARRKIPDDNLDQPEATARSEEAEKQKIEEVE